MENYVEPTLECVSEPIPDRVSIASWSNEECNTCVI